MNDYGKRDKRISFMDTDKRNAEMIIRLKHDGITKTQFFRAILTGYLERDQDMVEFINHYKEEAGVQSSVKRAGVNKVENEGNKNKTKFGLNDGDIKNIFDLLEKEHPDL